MLGHMWNVLTLTESQLHVLVPLIHVAVNLSRCYMSSLAFRRVLCCTDPMAAELPQPIRCNRGPLGSTLWLPVVMPPLYLTMQQEGLVNIL